MRAICCAILAYLFFSLATKKLEGGIFMTKIDTAFALLWTLLCHVSIIAAIVLCIVGL